MRKYPWLKMRKKTDPELPLEPPIMLGNKSNGEFFWAQTPRERKMRDMILRLSDERAARLGMDRRDFLASALGMVTSLYVVNLASGCGAGDDGGYSVREDLIECDVATEMLSGDEFILDLQTHHIEDEATWRDRHPGGAYGGDGFAQFLTLWDCPPRNAQCIGPQTYLE